MNEGMALTLILVAVAGTGLLLSRSSPSTVPPLVLGHVDQELQSKCCLPNDSMYRAAVVAANYLLAKYPMLTEDDLTFYLAKRFDNGWAAYWAVGPFRGQRIMVISDAAFQPVFESLGWMPGSVYEGDTGLAANDPLITNQLVGVSTAYYNASVAAADFLMTTFFTDARDLTFAGAGQWTHPTGQWYAKWKLAWLNNQTVTVVMYPDLTVSFSFIGQAVESSPLLH